jgi:hypothetical protein
MFEPILPGWHVVVSIHAKDDRRYFDSIEKAA